MAGNTATDKPPVKEENIAASLAKAIANGDIVNFRFAFSPNSPLRQRSVERLETPKYAYMRPTAEEEGTAAYREALALAQQPDMQAYVQRQLEKAGPPQLPSDLVLPLADNAVRLEKYHSAAQAYELLRIRRRMQDEFLAIGDRALEEKAIDRAVRAYLITAGLSYNYAAFPEPLPLVPNFQARALMLHGTVPRRPEEQIGWLPPQVHLRVALDYLLLNGELAARLDKQDEATRTAFVAALVRARDPEWDAFAERYREAYALVQGVHEEMKALEEKRRGSGNGSTLTQESHVEEQYARLREVPALLLGYEIPEGTWWQYLRELAYEHPAAALFIGRQDTPKDGEILITRCLDTPLVRVLDLILLNEAGVGAEA